MRRNRTDLSDTHTHTHTHTHIHTYSQNENENENEYEFFLEKKNLACHAFSRGSIEKKRYVSLAHARS